MSSDALAPLVFCPERDLAVLRTDELPALPELAAAHAQAVSEGAVDRQRVIADIAVLALAAAYGDLREAAAYVARMRALPEPSASADEAEHVLRAGAQVAATVLVDTQGYDSPAVRAWVDDAMRRLEAGATRIAADVQLVVARALLEYCEQQPEPDLYARIETLMARSGSAQRGSPVCRARFLVMSARCALRLDAFDPETRDRGRAAALLAEASAIAEDPACAFVRFHVREAQLMIALAGQDAVELGLRLHRLQESLDPRRPLWVAICNAFAARLHLMRGEVARGFEAASHAVRASQQAGCGPGERLPYDLVLSMARLASGQVARAIEGLRELLSATSGRRRAALACTLAMAEAWQARAQGEPVFDAALRRAFEQAEELNWPLFLNTLPQLSATLIGEALRRGIAVELATRAVQLRRLNPPADADESWPWPLRVFVLGRLEVCRPDGAIGLSGRAHKVVELLKLLAISGPHGRPMAWFADRMWPESDGDVATHNLEVTLGRLRRLLGVDGAILAHDHALALDATKVWVDWRELMTTCTRVQELIAGPVCDTDALEGALRRALQLRRGAAMAGETERALAAAGADAEVAVRRAVLDGGALLAARGRAGQARALYLQALAAGDSDGEYRRALSGGSSLPT